MKKIFLIYIISLISTLLYQDKLNAYSPYVHKKMTEKVINQNITKLNDYLKEYGFTDGILEYIDNKPARWWIEHGSEWEDYDIGWVLDLLTSHYYNPYTNKGLTEGGITIGVSAYDRANDLNNYYSWKNARDNFIKSLRQYLKWGGIYIFIIRLTY